MSKNTFLAPDPVFPYFFDKAELVLNLEELEREYEAEMRYAREVRRKALDICAFEKYFPSPLVIERFFIKDDSLLGYQCVFFDGNREVTSVETRGLRALTFKELVNSLDRRVLLKIAIVWDKDEPEIHPVPALFSDVMKVEDLQFMQAMLMPYTHIDSDT